MSQTLRTGLVQLTSGDDVDENIKIVSSYIEQAAGDGCRFILTPEMTNVLDTRRQRLLDRAHGEDEDTALKALRRLAAKHGIWLLIGSLALRISHDRLCNRSFLIAPDGSIKARYDKIHMFDVDLHGGESYRESKTYQAGETLVVANTPFARVGMTICYDLRFAEQYRRLALAGANLLVVPSAFTRTTGEAHWHTLLCARAIETGCFVLAPAQVGLHANNRATFGHSLVVNPWGKIICDGGTAPGVLTATLNMSEVEKARQKIPALKAPELPETLEILE
jgi:deaminated glutathione amidase